MEANDTQTKGERGGRGVGGGKEMTFNFIIRTV